MTDQRRLTIVWAGVSLAGPLKLYQSRRESQAGGLCSNPGRWWLSAQAGPFKTDQTD